MVAGYDDRRRDVGSRRAVVGMADTQIMSSINEVDADCTRYWFVIPGAFFLYMYEISECNHRTCA